jgi:hypothetical protein
MPASLEAIYNRILLNINDPDMVSDVCRTMNWLIFSSRPMKLNEIIDSLAFDFNQEPLCFDSDERMQPQALLAACGGFVILSEDNTPPEDDTVDDSSQNTGPTLKLAHASVKEYFLSAKKPEEICCGVSEQIAHHLIVRTCIAYLWIFDHIYEDAELKQYPLAHYAAGNWAFHLKELPLIKQHESHVGDFP